MDDLKLEYKRLLNRYNSLSQELAILRERKAQAKQRNKELVDEAKKLLKKDEIKDLDLVIQKLEKVVREKEEILKKEISEKEKLVGKFLSSDSEKDNLDILEEFDEF